MSSNPKNKNIKPLQAIKLVLLVLIIPTLWSCSSDKLTRGKAKRLILKIQKYPIPLTRNIPKNYYIDCWCSGWSTCLGGSKSDWENDSKDINLFLNRGLVSIGEETTPSGECNYLYKVITITDKGKQLLINETEGGFEVKTSELEFVEVTGVLETENKKEAEVEFTTRINNQTNFAAKEPVGKEPSELIKNSVRMVKYDDGWRIAQ